MHLLFGWVLVAIWVMKNFRRIFDWFGGGGWGEKARL
jgi:hypothetical protein